MTTATTILSWSLAVAPVSPTDVEVAHIEDNQELVTIDDASHVDSEAASVVIADEYTTDKGHRVRWASATYSLPDGQIAEVVIAADDTASGDAYLFVDGEAIVHSSYDDTNGVVSWTSSEPGTGELAAAALAGLSGGVGDELLDAFTDPQEFPCSEWGKKVLKAGKYIWGSVVAGSGAVCCTATGGVGCFACGAGSWALIEARGAGGLL